MNHPMNTVAPEADDLFRLVVMQCFGCDSLRNVGAQLSSAHSCSVRCASAARIGWQLAHPLHMTSKARALRMVSRHSAPDLSTRGASNLILGLPVFNRAHASSLPQRRLWHGVGVDVEPPTQKAPDHRTSEQAVPSNSSLRTKHPDKLTLELGKESRSIQEEFKTKYPS